MLVIRFSRVGKKKQPYYRIIISEKHKDPWGNYLELLGNYNPRTKEVTLKEDRIKHWLSVGAQASSSVHNLLMREGIIEAKDKMKAVKISKKRTAKKEKASAETAKKNEKPTEVKKEIKEEPSDKEPASTAKRGEQGTSDKGQEKEDEKPKSEEEKNKEA